MILYRVYNFPETSKDYLGINYCEYVSNLCNITAEELLDRKYFYTQNHELFDIDLRELSNNYYSVSYLNNLIDLNKYIKVILSIKPAAYINNTRVSIKCYILYNC